MNMTVEGIKLWIAGFDVAAKIAIAVVAGLWVLYTYPDSREKEFRKSYWDRQMSLYFDATQAASQVASLPSDDAAREKALQRFWELYWGQMVVVESKCERCDVVDQAMIRFGHCLTQPGSDKPKETCDYAELQQRAFGLGKACRDSIGASWDKKLKFLTEGCPSGGQPCS